MENPRVTQPLPLREQLKALEHLQELDLKIDALKKRKSGLPIALKAVEEQYQKALGAVRIKNTAIEDIEKAMRQSQAALELNRDRIARANAKLEVVQNGQEFNAANKELDQLKK